MKRERLGLLRIPSRALVLADLDDLSDWKHEVPPDDECLDVELTGPQAAEAGRQFDRDWDPERIHDIPADEADEICAQFVAFCEREKLDANARVLEKREPHLTRAQRALARGGGGVSFHDHWAVVAPLDAAESYEVAADVIDEGPNEGRFHTVFIELAPGAQVARSEPLGQVMCDRGRLVLADLETLAQWKPEESLDGLADVAFWGRDAKLAAEHTGALPLESRAFGWTGLSTKEAEKHGREVEKERAERGLRFTLDVRPHSHRFTLLEHMRESPTGSGTVELGNATFCGFASTWGDGVFPVFRDLDADGRPVRIRIELATEETPTIH